MKRNKKTKVTKKHEAHCDGCGEALGPEDLKMSCGVCEIDLGEDTRYVVTDSVQKVVWDDPDRPGIHVVQVIAQEHFCCVDHAIAGSNDYLSKFAADVKLLELQPVQDCICCGVAFRTDVWHRALMLTVERGNKVMPTMLGGANVARVCPTCTPTDEHTEALDTRFATGAKGMAVVKNVGLQGN